MNDQSKKNSNPLFNAAVTGNTYEDFSQHAVLHPAEEKPPAPNLNIPPEQLLKEIIPNNNSVTELQEQKQKDIPPPQEAPLLPDLSSLQPHLSQPQPQTSSNFSSVFSSFSNILNIGVGNNNNQAKEEFVAPPPAGLDNLIGQENLNPEPVPLFPANVSSASQLSGPPITGSTNVFRRPGLKRPSYAPIPGLSNGLTESPSQKPPTVQPNPLNLFTPPVSSSQTFSASTQPPSYPSSQSPANSISSITSGKELSTSSFFKPITPPSLDVNASSAQPPELNSVAPNPFSSQYTNNSVSQQIISVDETFDPQPQANFIPPYTQTFSGPQTSNQFHHHHFFVPETSKHVSGLVMDAIPPSELLQPSNMNNMEQYGMGTNGSLGSAVTENNNTNNQTYRPVYHHWFLQKDSEGKKIWQPFSMVDSLALEKSYTSNDLDPDKVIATDGGRYDVNILRRQRIPVYWKGNPNEVRRCSWFHKDSPNGRLVPYEENVATRLEEEYKQAFLSNSWHKRVELANGEVVVFHGPDVLVLFPRSSSPDVWGNTTNQTRPRIVKRGMDEFDIDEGESVNADHILFMIHGIGSVCDLKFKSVEETVDEFRAIALQLVRSHYKSSCEKGVVSRVEVLPISWHDKLHSEETGIDSQLKSITLESIPKLRDFTNDTLLDILFYTSPIYCQQIISSAANELNRVYDLYKLRNPEFKGGISLGGHSLGSLIIFDLLAHQVEKEDVDEEPPVLEDDEFPPKEIPKPPPPVKRQKSRRISYMMGSTGTGQPEIFYPHLNFEPKMFFALGSPIGMFIIVRGLYTLGENFALPTCPHFFNIFHPYDPIAYRIESLIDTNLGKLKPVLIPHHKGRKRMHLELKETMARVGADLKQKVIDSLKSTWDTFTQYSMFHKPDHPSLEDEVQKVIDEQIVVEGMEERSQEQDEVPHGKLNSGRRIDYVLQEAPFEFINEYIFALTSHVCYWESEDTILMMLKEIYTSMDIQTDSQLPPQTMTIERPPPSPTSLRSTRLLQKIEEVKDHLPPPPTSGFVKKT